MKDARDDRGVAKDPQTAYDEAYAAAIAGIAELIREAEKTGDPYNYAEMNRLLESLPPNPNPPTEAEVAEARRWISEVLALHP